MDAYKNYCNDGDINKIIDTINEMHKGMFAACHGRYHAMFVVDMAEHILKSLSYDPRIIELGKIAALMHDIGNIAGRWNHARKSAALAAVFLDGSVDFSPEEKNMIVQAIEDHSTGKNISSAVGAALLIADKVDISKRRVLPSETIDAWHKNLLEIEDVDVHVSSKAIIINYITTEAFSKNLLVSEYTKGFSLPIKAANYLGCTCHFQFNGKEYNFV